MKIEFINNSLNKTALRIILFFGITFIFFRYYGVIAYAAISDDTISVTKTYNNSQFNYTIKFLEKREAYDVYKLTYPSPMESRIPCNNTVHAWYYLPNSIRKDSPPRPAVICLHILGGGQELTHMVCSFMAEQGIPAMIFLFPYYGERKPIGWEREMFKRPDSAVIFADSLQQMVADTRRAVDVLATRPEVNKNKISIEGISLGGYVAVTAASLDARIDKLAILLAGGDLDRIIGNSRETRWLRQFIDSLAEGDRRKVNEAIRQIDPLTNAAKLRRKSEESKIMMTNATMDEVVPPECSKRLAEEMGMSAKQEWLEGLGHYTAIASLPRTLHKMSDFFSDGTIPIVEKKAELGAKVPLFAKFMGNLENILQFTPESNRCYLLEADVTVKFKRSGDMKGSVWIVRGGGEKFVLKVCSPLFSGALGHGAYPWLVSRKGIVFKGNLTEEKDFKPWRQLSPLLMSYHQMAVGICALGMSSSSSLLEQMVKIEEKDVADGKAELLISTKDSRNVFHVLFKNGDGIPEKIDFNLSGDSGTIVFREWNTEAISTPELFQEPDSVRCEEVRREDLDGIFTALLNQLVEKTK